MRSSVIEILQHLKETVFDRWDNFIFYKYFQAAFYPYIFSYFSYVLYSTQRRILWWGAEIASQPILASHIAPPHHTRFKSTKLPFTRICKFLIRPTSYVKFVLIRVASNWCSVQLRPYASLFVPNRLPGHRNECASLSRDSSDSNFILFRYVNTLLIRKLESGHVKKT